MIDHESLKECMLILNFQFDGLNSGIAMVNMPQLTQLGVLTGSVTLVGAPDISSRPRIQAGTSTLLNVPGTTNRVTEIPGFSSGWNVGHRSHSTQPTINCQS
jgi:hypothetical protein